MSTPSMAEWHEHYSERIAELEHQLAEANENTAYWRERVGALESQLAEAQKKPDYEAWDKALRKGWEEQKRKFDAEDAAIAAEPSAPQQGEQ